MTYYFLCTLFVLTTTIMRATVPSERFEQFARCAHYVNDSTQKGKNEFKTCINSSLKSLRRGTLLTLTLRALVPKATALYTVNQFGKLLDDVDKKDIALSRHRAQQKRMVIRITSSGMDGAANAQLLAKLGLDGEVLKNLPPEFFALHVVDKVHTVLIAKPTEHLTHIPTETYLFGMDSNDSWFDYEVAAYSIISIITGAAGIYMGGKSDNYYEIGLAGSAIGGALRALESPRVGVINGAVLGMIGYSVEQMINLIVLPSNTEKNIIQFLGTQEECDAFLLQDPEIFNKSLNLSNATLEVNP